MRPMWLSPGEWNGRTQQCVKRGLCRSDPVQGATRLRRWEKAWGINARTPLPQRDRTILHCHCKA